MEQGFFTVDGLKMRYLTWGRQGAEPIVLVHGFSSTAEAWERVGETLANDYFVVAPDLRGHGESAWDPQQRYSNEHMVADVHALLQQLGLTSYIFVGHSMGGSVAFAYAATYPNEVKKLVIEDSAPLPPGRQPSEVRNDFSSRDEVAASVRAAQPTMSEEAVQGRVDRYYRQQPDGTWGFRADVMGVRRGRVEDSEKAWANVRRVQCPTLVIRAGAEPPLVSQETADRLPRENPRISVITVPGAGHNIHFAHFDQFMPIFRQFLAEPAAVA